MLFSCSFDDLDLEVPEDSHKYCGDEAQQRASGARPINQPCCAYNWIKIGPTVNNQEQRYCGHSDDNKLTLAPFISVTNHVWVKFHTAIKVKGGRGFHLSYVVGLPKASKCNENEFHCANERCILNSWRCNRKDECGMTID